MTALHIARSFEDRFLRPICPNVLTDENSPNSRHACGEVCITIYIFVYSIDKRKNVSKNVLKILNEISSKIRPLPITYMTFNDPPLSLTHVVNKINVI